tara:strand:+ start:160 stop:363 length:204 start_codon:yes stop_codon:yes gene_type:complete
MNLFERLKDEHKEKLAKQNVLYPALVGDLVDVLEKATFIRLLTYGDVVTLKQILGTTVSPYELFNEL